jgi:hypothetical protein
MDPFSGAHGYAPRPSAAWLAAIAFAVAVIGLLAFKGTARAEATTTSADEIVFWTSLEDATALTDAQLDTYATMGVDGLVLSAARLKGAGGSKEWTADPSDPLSGARYAPQRRIRDSEIVSRAGARGIDLYLAYKVDNPYNDSTPYVEWFDDAAWATVTESIGDLAGAAHMLGLKGIAVDQELYKGSDDKHKMWKWDYPGNTHTEEQVREMVAQRGAQAAAAALEAFPDLEWAVYNFFQEDSWFEVKYEEQGFVPRWGERVDIDWWNGVAGVEGYAAIRQWNNVFYKNPWPAQGESNEERWETAMLWDVSQTAALLSRRFENWGHAHSRYFSSPFVWITDGPKEDASGDDAKPPEYVATQLSAAREFGMGGGFANYSYFGLTDTAQYAPYASVIQAASTPGDVDSTPPTLQLTGDSAEITGTAHDNLAVWAVRWEDDLGESGTAELTFTVTQGDRLDIEEWRMEWTIPRDELTAGASSVTIVAEDIKGNESERTIEMD